jgi:hypothetical protein
VNINATTPTTPNNTSTTSITPTTPNNENAQDLDASSSELDNLDLDTRSYRKLKSATLNHRALRRLGKEKPEQLKEKLGNFYRHETLYDSSAPANYVQRSFSRTIQIPAELMDLQGIDRLEKELAERDRATESPTRQTRSRNGSIGGVPSGEDSTNSTTNSTSTKKVCT